MRDIEIAVGKTEREEFIRFGIKDYGSFRQRASRLVARARGKTVYSRKEFIEKLIKFSEVIYPYPKK
jgi:hypothetical protein